MEKLYFDVLTIGTGRMCRIVTRDIRSELRDLADGGCICSLEVMLCVMQDITERAAKLGYEAVFSL